MTAQCHESQLEKCIARSSHHRDDHRAIPIRRTFSTPIHQDFMKADAIPALQPETYPSRGGGTAGAGTVANGACVAG